MYDLLLCCLLLCCQWSGSCWECHTAWSVVTLYSICKICPVSAVYQNIDGIWPCVWLVNLINKLVEQKLILMYSSLCGWRVVSSKSWVLFMAFWLNMPLLCNLIDLKNFWNKARATTAAIQWYFDIIKQMGNCTHILTISATNCYWNLFSFKIEQILMIKCSMFIFGRPYYRSSLWHDVSSVVCLSSVCLWRYVLWQNGAS